PRERRSTPAVPQPERAKRESSPPNANVVRRDPSQPPFEPKTISLQPPPPSRLDRRSADGPDPLAPERKSTPVIDPSRGSQPPFRPSPPPPAAVLPPHEPVMEPMHEPHARDPRYA